MVQLKRNLDTKQKKKLAAGDEGPKQICSYDAIFKNVLKKKTFFF